MPRTARASEGGVVYHVLNRGKGRQAVFHGDGDYAAFSSFVGRKTKGSRGKQRGREPFLLPAGRRSFAGARFRPMAGRASSGSGGM